MEIVITSKQCPDADRPSSLVLFYLAAFCSMNQISIQ